MATVLELVMHYQRAIEKFPHVEHIVLKSIEQLFELNVTVEHLEVTGVGRTVNALRRETGILGQAARSLVYKWKIMIAVEEMDQDDDHDDIPDNDIPDNIDPGNDTPDNIDSGIDDPDNVDPGNDDNSTAAA